MMIIPDDFDAIRYACTRPDDLRAEFASIDALILVTRKTVQRDLLDVMAGIITGGIYN